MWNSLSKIVYALKGHDHPGYVLAVVLAMCFTAIGIAGLVSLGAASIGDAIRLLR